MSDEAEEYFYGWYNDIIEEINAIEDDAEVESRKMKLNGNAARLSLVFQILRWATDEGLCSASSSNPFRLLFG